MNPDFILLLIAFICFVAAAVGASPPRVNLIGAGLAAYIATMLF